MDPFEQSSLFIWTALNVQQVLASVSVASEQKQPILK